MNIVKTVEEYDNILNNNAAVFVDFYADWCGPCKMLGPVVEELAKEVTDVTFVKVNVDALPDVAGRYGVMSIPTLIVFKNGETVATTVGFQPKEALMNLISKVK